MNTTPAAACPRCGGWTPCGGMSQHASSAELVQGRPGCTCNRPKPEPDVLVYVDGTIALFFGQSPAGETWLDESLEEGPMMGKGYAVETRYAPAIVQGLCSAGLDVKVTR